MSFVSVALFRRGGETVYRAPHREVGRDLTQARKAASRYWNGRIKEPDRLDTLFVVEVQAGCAVVSERAAQAKEWMRWRAPIAHVRRHAHIVACLVKLNIDPDRAGEPPPETLTINGYTYRRDSPAEEI